MSLKKRKELGFFKIGGYVDLGLFKTKGAKYERHGIDLTDIFGKDCKIIKRVHHFVFSLLFEENKEK